MTKGGARPRSGPAADPNSRTSERRRAAEKRVAQAKAAEGSTDLPITATDFNPMALPARGRSGRAPAFPLPRIVRNSLVTVDGKAVKTVDAKVTTAFRTRELELWRELWKTPQAVAWEREPYRWPTIAKYARVMAATEAEPDASAALLSRERELRIECGLSPDGLRANGWAIAPDQLAEKRATKKTAPAKAAPAPVRRLRG